MSFVLTTFNICGEKKFENQIQNIADYLEKQNSDVICLQEVRLNPERSPYSQAKILNELISTGQLAESITRYYMPSKGDAYREGLAIISKYPLSNIEGYAHTKMPNDKHQRIALLADIETPEGMLQIANVHFSNNQYSEMQLNELMNLFKSRNEQRIIIGDFNMPPEQVRDLARSDYKSSYDFKDYISFPAKSETLDYALAPTQYKITSVTADDVDLSDHSPLIVEIG